MNGYHDGVVCEHRIGPQAAPCGDAAAVVLWGVALCEPHFEDRVVTASMGLGGLARAIRVRDAAVPVPIKP